MRTQQSVDLERKLLKADPATSAVIYKCYMIRSSPVYSRVWIERDKVFISWAADLEHAQGIIDECFQEATS